MSERIINIVINQVDEPPIIYSYMVRGFNKPEEVIEEVKSEFKQMIQAWFPEQTFEQSELDIYAEERFYFNDDKMVEFYIVLSNI
jgi:hypothetical protein